MLSKRLSKLAFRSNQPLFYNSFNWPLQQVQRTIFINAPHKNSLKKHSTPFSQPKINVSSSVCSSVCSSVSSSVIPSIDQSISPSVNPSAGIPSIILFNLISFNEDEIIIRGCIGGLLGFVGAVATILYYSSTDTTANFIRIATFTVGGSIIGSVFMPIATFAIIPCSFICLIAWGCSTYNERNKSGDTQ